MPLDAGARWMIEIAAADKTADAFSSATARMKAFGDTTGGAAKKNADALGALAPLYDSIAGKISAYTKAFAAAFTVGAIIQRGKEIEDYALKIDKMAKAFKSSTVEAQALDAAAQRTGKTAEELNEQLSAAQRKMLGDIYKAAFGDTTRILDDVTKASTRLSDTYSDLTQASRQAMIAMFGDLTVGVLNALTTAIVGWSAAMRDAGAVLDRVGKSPQLPSVQSFTDSGQNVVTGISGGFEMPAGGPLASAMDIVDEKFKDTQAELGRLREQLQQTRVEFDRDGDRGGVLADDIANLERRILSLTGALIGLNNTATGTAAALSPFAGTGVNLGADAFAGRGPNVLAPYLPGASEASRWMIEGLKPPVTGGSGGAGGGKSDNDNIDAQIKRYTALADVAKRAGAVIDANHAKNIEDLQREVRVQEQVEEIAAKLGAKFSEADAAHKAQLHDEIALYEQRKAANQLALESATKAEEMEVKFGDGTRARALLERDLARALDTGRVSTEALLRVEKQRTEELEQQRLQARRFDDNLGSLGAGFQNAANSYARANDLFSQGGQIFDGITAAMGDGLDVLAGRSNKTFAQIASDFAAMLTKMALQAALSPLFKLAGGALSGWLGGLFGGGGVTPPPLGGTDTGSFLPSANGNAFMAGNVIPFARGGIVHRPTLFPMANGAGLMGEAGPEAVMPLSRGRGGRLGVEASGWGGGAPVNLSVQVINAGSPVKETGRQQRQTSNGTEVKVFVAMVEAEIAGNVQRDQGSLNAALQGKFGIQRAPR